MAEEDTQRPSQEAGGSSPLSIGAEEPALDKEGNPLEPPYYLVSDIVSRKLLSSTLSQKGALSARRVQEMIGEGVLPARKAELDEVLLLLKKRRIRRVTDKGIWLVAPSALSHAEHHRKRVGFPKGGERPKRGKTSGAHEAGKHE